MTPGPGTGGAVVLVDPYSSGVALGKALRRAGLTTYAVLSYPPPDPRLTRTFEAGDHTDVISAEKGFSRVVDFVRNLGPLAVIAGIETGVELADSLSAELGLTLANDPALSRARRDKAAMMRTLQDAGVPVIRSMPVTDWRGSAQTVAAHGLSTETGDLVVKPTRSAMSDGLRLARRGSDLEATVREVLGTRNVMGSVNDTVLVQERVHGTEYVVDTFSDRGHHVVTNVCRYNKVAFGDSFAVYESTDFLPEDSPEIAALVPYVKRVLNALGIRFGACHNEVMLTEDGPLLMETGARLAGSGLVGAAELATGGSGISRYVQRLAEGATDGGDYRLQRRVRGVYLVFRRHGTVTNTAALERIRTLRSCRHAELSVRDGDVVSPTGGLMSTMTRGWALLAHRDLDQVERDHEEFRRIESELTFTGHAGEGR
nr:ATP-grasp domain-containing protein [Streptomyces pseudovenezuelae]